MFEDMFVILKGIGVKNFICVDQTIKDNRFHSAIKAVSHNATAMLNHKNFPIL